MQTFPAPGGQPRSLRSIAEDHAAPSSFPPDLPYDYQAGTPSSATGGGQAPVDVAAEANKSPKSDKQT